MKGDGIDGRQRIKDGQVNMKGTWNAKTEEETGHKYLLKVPTYVRYQLNRA